MKSSGFCWESSFVIELLAASLLGSDGFCANATFVAASTITIRVITRKFFWFTAFLPYSETRVGHKGCPQLSTTPNSLACTIPIEWHRVTLSRSGSRVVAPPLARVEVDFETTNSQDRVHRHRVSNVTCHVTWRVVGLRPWAFPRRK